MTKISQNREIILKMCVDYYKERSNTTAIILDEFLEYFYGVHTEPTLRSRIRGLLNLLVKYEYLRADEYYKDVWDFTSAFRLYQKCAPKDSSVQDVNYDSVYLSDIEQFVLDKCLEFIDSAEYPGFSVGEIWNIVREDPSVPEKLDSMGLGIILRKELCLKRKIIEECSSYKKFLYAEHAGGYYYQINPAYLKMLQEKDNPTDLLNQLQKEFVSLQKQMEVVNTLIQQIQKEFDK